MEEEVKKEKHQASEKLEARLEIPWREDISRLFIFRPLWMFIFMWVFWVWAMWISIITFIQFWYMLILGKKQKTLWEKNVRFVRAQTKWNAYFQNLTDKRPKFIEE